MSEIINLRLARKRAARIEREAVAVASRAKHGMSKVERQLRDLEAAKARALLDSVKREV